MKKPLRPRDLAQILADSDAEAARRSLHEFVRQGWHAIEPADPFQDNWHVGAVCEVLEAVSRGQIRKLAINIPPGTLKSTLAAVAWPAWVWTWRPEWRGLFASYSHDLAVRDAVKARTLMESEWYQRSFVLGRGPRGGLPLWRFSDDMNRKDMYTNTRTGMRLSLSPTSKGTGFRGNVVCVDDPLNASDAPSKLERDRVIYWWDKVMSNRVNRPEEDAFVIMMQRLHEDDPTGHVLRAGGYEHLCLPSEFNSKRRSVVHFRRTPASEPEVLFRDPRERDGELLFPRRFTANYLAEQKKSLREDYAGQHDQQPAPATGNMFKFADWRFWRHEGASTGRVAGVEIALDPARFPRQPDCHQGPAKVIPQINYLIGSLDAAFKGEATSDYVVFGMWGIAGAERYLLDLVRAKMDYVQTKKEFRRLRDRWPRCMKWLVEDKANGSAIIAELQAEIPGITAVNPEGGKESRAAAMSPQVESGQVLLPDGASWTYVDESGQVRELVPAFIDEHAGFPRARNDDMVDMTSQVMIHLATSREAARTALLFTA